MGKEDRERLSKRNVRNYRNDYLYEPILLRITANLCLRNNKLIILDDQSNDKREGKQTFE